ncbi:GspH/FimT family pseudopilin [Endozoicomonas sp. SCSIO W0465]|uniref:GspH/FimT family pseudopilin n=1 Tax=Endozoicomonas sp. SCSIO W0465 TaxID=2918516 RepID=UPI0020757BA8|nr:GspH/FimT family pseudopilin [Endozoicomonas sp. SCSIO W0465]USE37533.1 GspH/FimT family pseudopilin [Endozoicomonas sp. SCSIO W0465]
MDLLFLHTTLNHKDNRGFTLVEMMITVVLIAIMVNLVAPMGQIAEGFKLDYVNQRIYSSAVLARSEAIKRSETVSVCRSISGTACQTGTNWADGWVIFVNNNGNNSIDPGEEIIRVYNPASSPVEITWSGSVPLLNFRPRGSPDRQGTFTLCSVPKRPMEQRLVDISGSGLIRKREGVKCLLPTIPSP